MRDDPFQEFWWNDCIAGFVLLLQQKEAAQPSSSRINAEGLSAFPSIRTQC